MFILFSIYTAFLVYVAVTVLYIAVFSVAGRIGRADDVAEPVSPKIFRKIGVLIPAYKEDAVIVESVQANLRQTYPADRYDLIVIADSLQRQTLTRLATLPVRVIEVSFDVSTVTKAITTALARIDENEYDILAVADADNLLAPDFLSRVNVAFEQGWRAVQGHRIAKNMNTSVAVLDAISEEINNHIFRKGTRALGLSSPVIGSGMAMDATLMRTCLTNLKTMGGYDKELEMNVVLSGNTIGYLEQAYVYDEKVAQRAVFEHQRTRWIAAQWQFLRLNFRRGVIELLAGRSEVVLGLFRAVILPRVMLLGLLGICTIGGLLSQDTLLWALPLVTLVVLWLSLFMAVPRYLWQRITLRELLLIPVMMLSFGRAMLNMRRAFRSFMHTPHSSSTGAPVQ